MFEAKAIVELNYLKSLTNYIKYNFALLFFTQMYLYGYVYLHPDDLRPAVHIHTEKTDSGLQ